MRYLNIHGACFKDKYYIMKFFCFLIMKCIYTLYPESWYKHIDYGIWGILGFVNIYLVVFVFLPILEILGSDVIQFFEEEKYNALWIAIPLFLLEAVYFFWDDRYERIYNEMEALPASVKKKKLYHFTIGFVLLTVSSVIFMYFFVPFGRW